MPFYPSWVVYIDQAAKGEAVEPMHRTEAKWAIESIREMQAELDAARARAAELHEAVRPALPYLDQHPGQGQETAARLRELLTEG